MRRVVVVIADIKASEIGLVLLAHLTDHLLRGNAKLLSFQHDWRAVGIVGADEVDVVAAHSLVTDPDISLDVLQHMAEVDGAVCVRQRARYQNFFRDLSHSEHYVFCKKRGFDITKWGTIK